MLASTYGTFETGERLIDQQKSERRKFSDGSASIMKELRLSVVVALFALGTGIIISGLANSSDPVSTTVNLTPSDPVQNQTQGAATLEMVFVLDTTGSMGGLIEGAKQRIWGIVNEVMQSASRPAVRVGLVAYRDRGDEYVTKILPLTNDLDKVYSELMNYSANGGGDGPENVRRALADGVRKAGWSERARGLAQIVFLVGDAPPHNYQDEPDTTRTVGEAVHAGMIVNTIQCGNQSDTRQIWQTIARLGEGEYFSIAQDGGVVAISTPYDKQLSELGAKLGSTYLAYGGGAGAEGRFYRKELKEKQADMEIIVSASAPQGAAADRAVNKAVNAEAYAGDLLTALENGSVKLDAVKDDDLPDDLKKMEPEARKKEVDKRLAQRKQMREEILKLSKQREEFIATERKKQSGKQDGFDVAVTAALKQQLNRKGIKW